MTNTSSASTSHGHGTDGRNGNDVACRTVDTSDVHVSTRNPRSTCTGSPSTVSRNPVAGDTGATGRSDASAAPDSSSAAANAPIRGWSYTSATVVVGNLSRIADTSCAAVNDPPPCAKKSSSTPVTGTPRIADHRSAIHATVSGRSATSATPGSGHGSAARSTLPDVRVGSESTTATSGTSAAGSSSRNRAFAAATSTARPATGATYPTSTWLPAGVRCTTAAPPATPSNACSAASTSPSSIRRPPSFTWSSARPWNTSPSGSYRTRSPLRYARSHPSSGNAAYFSASFAGSRYRPSPTPPITSSPTPPGATRCPASSTTARSHPSNGSPIRTGAVPSMSAPHATTVASVGPYVFHSSRPRDAIRAASSGGHASPPKITSRTCSSASSGHSAASVGTVDTTVIVCAINHGPRSTPVRTSDRGAGTRHAPCPHASHISSHDASNATLNPASTRSPGPIGASCRNIRASASTNAAALRCVTATPFGTPVDPEVKMIHASSSSRGRSALAAGSVTGRGVPSRSASTPPAPMTPTTPASPKTSVARSSGSSASTGTYAAPAASTARIDT